MRLFCHLFSIFWLFSFFSFSWPALLFLKTKKVNKNSFDVLFPCVQQLVVNSLSLVIQHFCGSGLKFLLIKIQLFQLTYCCISHFVCWLFFFKSTLFIFMQPRPLHLNFRSFKMVAAWRGGVSECEAVSRAIEYSQFSETRSDFIFTVSSSMAYSLSYVNSSVSFD